MNDHGYRVFRRAVWLGGGLKARSVWPILLVVLPLIWELVKAFMASRAARLHGSPEDVAMAVRDLSAELEVPGWARRAWTQAEWDVSEGRD